MRGLLGVSGVWRCSFNACLNARRRGLMTGGAAGHRRGSCEDKYAGTRAGTVTFTTARCTRPQARHQVRDPRRQAAAHDDARREHGHDPKNSVRTCQGRDAQDSKCLIAHAGSCVEPPSGGDVFPFSFASDCQSGGSSRIAVATYRAAQLRIRAAHLGSAEVLRTLVAGSSVKNTEFLGQIRPCVCSDVWSRADAALVTS